MPAPTAPNAPTPPLARMHMPSLPTRLMRPEAPARFRWTDRHVAIMEFVAQYRTLATDQIARAVGGSPRGVGSNLRNLFRHGYLDRPQGQYAQLAAFADDGNRPLVYSLTRKGARFLSERGHALDHRLDWSFRRVTPLFLAHTIQVAEIMMQFGLADRDERAPCLIDHHELLPLMPEKTCTLRDPFRVSVTAEHERKPLHLTVVPDRLFSLAFPDRTRMNFALELRGTMDINAKRIVGKSSFRKKLIGYYNAWLRDKHTEVWGFQSFRVLTITPSERRLANMICAQTQVTNNRASGLFLYSTRERIEQHGVLGPAWRSSEEDNITLVRT